MFKSRLKQHKGKFIAACIPACVLLMLLSCLPDPLEVGTMPRARAQLVVSSLIIPDQSVLVLLTRSFGALEASDDTDPEALLEFIAVNDATVVLEGPEGRDTLQSLGNGIYGSAIIPLKAGEQYHLFVNSPEFGEVQATTEVKRKVNFAEAEAELFYTEFGDTLAQITYNFNDPPEKNWYMINVQEVEQEDFVENLINPRAFTIMLPDKDFNGLTYGERFRVFPRDYQPGDTIALSLSNISEEYYAFMKLRIDNRFTFVDFVSEPVNYPSNVVGGKGFFNLYLPDVRFFVFD